jgi:hypothetical protein
MAGKNERGEGRVRGEERNTSPVTWILGKLF